MARRNELTCDRCGRTIVDLDYSGLHVMKDSSAKIHYWGVGAPRSYGEQRIDLCIECAEAFVAFLNNENTGEYDNE
jgi:hypothetical protein